MDCLEDITYINKKKWKAKINNQEGMNIWKKAYKTRIVKRIASILTTITILISGGYTAVANMFGLNKNKNKILINEERDNQKIIWDVEKTNKNTFPQEKRYQYKYTSPEEKYLNDTPKTTETISHGENINRLIRKRKKITHEKINI